MSFNLSACSQIPLWKIIDKHSIVHNSVETKEPRVPPGAFTHRWKEAVWQPTRSSTSKVSLKAVRNEDLHGMSCMAFHFKGCHFMWFHHECSAWLSFWIRSDPLLVVLLSVRRLRCVMLSANKNKRSCLSLSCSSQRRIWYVLFITRMFVALLAVMECQVNKNWLIKNLRHSWNQYQQRCVLRSILCCEKNSLGIENV